MLPFRTYSPTGKTAHQGGEEVKHPNYHCSVAVQDRFGVIGSNFQVVLSSFSCESRCFPHKRFGQNPDVFTKVALKEIFQPFSLSTGIQLATQDCKVMPTMCFLKLETILTRDRRKRTNLVRSAIFT